jgi:hypothetical protein
LFRDHRRGSRGPPGGATCSGGLHGLNVGGNQPLVGWCASPQGPRAPRVGNPRGGGAPQLGGQGTPFGRRPLPRSDLGGADPSPPYPINREGVVGRPHPFTCRSPAPLSPPPPSVLGEALPENHELHRHHAAVLPELSLYFPSPLLDQEGGDVPGLYVC